MEWLSEDDKTFTWEPGGIGQIQRAVRIVNDDGHHDEIEIIHLAVTMFGETFDWPKMVWYEDDECLPSSRLC